MRATALLSFLALVPSQVLGEPTGDPAGLIASSTAVVPQWPAVLGRTYYGQDRARAGKLRVELEVGRDGAVYAATTALLAQPKSKRRPRAKYELEEDFHTVAVRAAIAGRYMVPADLCGTVAAVQEFEFDGSKQPGTFAGAFAAAAATEGATVDMVLAPVSIVAVIADPDLAPSGSMARRMPRSTIAPPALAASVPALAARRPLAAGLEPATVLAIDAADLLAATDLEEPRQLVIARFTVDAEGRAVDVALDRRHGTKGFEKAAARALASARFTPARRDGSAVAASACLSFGAVVEAREPSLE